MTTRFDETNIDIDFSQAAAWNEDMPERTRWLRANAPVYWSEKTQAYVVTRYRDVAYASKHNELFCSEQQLVGMVR